MISDDKLIGWICAIVVSHEEDMIATTPAGVLDMLTAKGWLVRDDDPDWQGYRPGELTPAGRTIIDLHGPDYGLTTIPEESEA